MRHHQMLTSTSDAFLPAMSAPPGEVSDLVNHANYLWTYNVAAQTLCMTTAGILFCLRCYVRLGLGRMPRQWTLEDCMPILIPHGMVAKTSVS
jgi:hypothetical protein